MDALLEQIRSDGLLTAETADKVADCLRGGGDLQRVLAEAGDLDPARALEYLGSLLGIEVVDLAAEAPTPEFIARCPARILTTYQLLPLSQTGQTLRVATGRPLQSEGLDELAMTTGLRTVPVLADPADVARCLNTLIGVGADTMEVLVSESGAQAAPAEDLGDVDLDAANDASIITFVNQVLTQAIDRRATDVHIEPFENSLRVRYRIDGILREAQIPREVRRFHAAIVSRLKILAALDIAEKRVPQDGRIKLRIGTRDLDVRVSVIPMLHGEAVVLRLLDRSATLLGLNHLGMSERDRASIDSVLDLPHGIVLVTGPTGSGKTTTLYACLNQINNVERKIVTIEDPIEYHLEGINQIQVAAKAGLSFARGLRSVLRHDPDVILVGEIRDEETAEIAVQASLTGHLVFSTLHTNDAPSAAIRLVDMGIEPYLVASSVEVVAAQRLVRTICPRCKEAYRPADLDVLRQRLGDDLPDELHRGAGCEHCGHTGYIGRKGIFEIMPVSEAIRSIILEQSSSSRIRAQAVREGMRSLRDDGLRLVRLGLTTPDEVLRVSKDELRETGQW